MKKILIIEDEKAIAMALEDDFIMEGFEVVVTNNGKSGMEMGMAADIDIILLDIMLPEMNGLEVCKALRKKGIYTPIIMLTAKSQEIDRILGLEIGADDYVSKPFSPRELQARVKAVLRRTELSSKAKNQPIRQFGDIKVDFDGYQVFKGSDEVSLTVLEFALLKFFMENSLKVLSRDEILRAVWGDNVMVELRTVDTHVANLRRKIENDPANSKWIVGVRGKGYKFVLF